MSNNAVGLGPYSSGSNHYEMCMSGLVVIWAFRHLGVQKKVIWAQFFWSFGRNVWSFGRTLWTFGRVCPKDYYSVIFGHLGVLFVIE